MDNDKKLSARLAAGEIICPYCDADLGVKKPPLSVNRPELGEICVYCEDHGRILPAYYDPAYTKEIMWASIFRLEQVYEEKDMKLLQAGSLVKYYGLYKQIDKIYYLWGIYKNENKALYRIKMMGYNARWYMLEV